MTLNSMKAAGSAVKMGRACRSRWYAHMPCVCCHRWGVNANASSLLSAAHKAAELVTQCGADDAQIAISRSRGVDIEWRDGQLERVQERTRQSLSVEVYVTGGTAPAQHRT